MPSRPGGEAAPSVVDLDEPAAGLPEIVGGKAAGLHRLRAFGLPSLHGIVITTHAYRAVARTLTPDGWVAETGERPLPAELTGYLESAVRGLGECRYGLAVRSSAVGEDGTRHSHAGQLRTLLGVRLDGLPGAVRQCWASLWSPHASAYRRRFEADGEPSMAIVVQPLIAPEVSAVLFTRDPGGSGDHIRVEITRGLGQPLASGQVTADSYLLDRITLRVAESSPGRHEFALFAGEEGIRRVTADTGEPVIEPPLVEALADLCLRAERSFGHPLDIEAALDGERRWWITQARPITTVR